MNPLYLYRKVRREPLAADELAWVGEQLKKQPYAAVLHLMRARHAQQVADKDTEKLRALAALYAPNRRLANLYLDDKLATRLESAKEALKAVNKAAAPEAKPTAEAPAAPPTSSSEAEKPLAREKAPVAPETPVPTPEPPKAKPPVEPPTPKTAEAPEAPKTQAPEPPATSKPAGLKIRTILPQEVAEVPQTPVRLPEESATVVENLSPAQVGTEQTVRPPNDPLPTTKTLTDSGDKEVSSPIELKEVPAPVINQGLQTMIQVRTGMYLRKVGALEQEIAAYKEKAGSDAPTTQPEAKVVLSEPAPTAKHEAPSVPAEPKTPAETALDLEEQETAEQNTPPKPEPVVTEPLVTAEVTSPEVPVETKPQEAPQATEAPKRQERVTIEQLNLEQQETVEQGVDDLKKNLLRLIQAQMSGDLPAVSKDKEAERKQESNDHAQALSEIDRVAKKLHTSEAPTLKTPATSETPDANALLKTQVEEKLPAATTEPPVVTKPADLPTPTETPEKEGLAGSGNSILRFEHPVFDEKPATLNVGGVVRQKSDKLGTDTEQPEQPALDLPVSQPTPPVTEAEVVPETLTPAAETPAVKEVMAPAPSPEPAVVASEQNVPLPAALQGKKLTTESFSRFVPPSFDRRAGMLNDPLPPEEESAETAPPVGTLPSVPLPDLSDPGQLDKPTDKQRVTPEEAVSSPSFKRFVAPAFGATESTPEVQPVAQPKAETPVAAPLPTEAPETTKPESKSSSTPGFGRFISPQFGELNVRTSLGATDPQVPAAEAPVPQPPSPKVEAEAVPPPAVKEEAQVPAPTVEAPSEPVENSMTRFVDLELDSPGLDTRPHEPSPVAPKANAPASTVGGPVETPAQLTKPTESPAGEESFKRFVGLEMEPSPQLLPTTHPEVAAEKSPSVADETLETEPTVPVTETTEAPSGEQTFTYRKGDLAIEIVLRPDQLQLFKQDPKKVFAEAADEVLAQDNTYASPEMQITIDSEKAVVEPLHIDVPQLQVLSPEELGRLKAALTPAAWHKLLAAFEQPPAITEPKREPLPTGKAVTLKSDSTVANRLEKLALELQQTRAENLENAEPIYGQVLEMHQQDDEELLRNFGLSTFYTQERPSTGADSLLAAEKTHALGGAGGDFSMPDEEAEETNLLSGVNLPHPDEITLQSIQRKFLSKIIAGMTESVTELPGTQPQVPVTEKASALLTEETALPSTGDNATSVDRALSSFQELAPALSEKLANLKSQAGTELPENEPVAHPATLDTSLEEEGPISETLAQILANQGKLAQAKAMYQQLALLHPEKSAYFADLLKQLGS